MHLKSSQDLTNLIFLSYGSDLECYLHVFTIPGSEDAYMLCLIVIVL